jgi:hypothetical protein
MVTRIVRSPVGGSIVFSQAVTRPTNINKHAIGPLVIQNCFRFVGRLSWETRSTTREINCKIAAVPLVF